MAGKHYGTGQYTSALAHPPAYPGSKENRAWAEGAIGNPASNPHTSGTPAYAAYAAGAAASDYQESGDGSRIINTTGIEYITFPTKNDYLQRATNLTGIAANLDACTMSFWVRDVGINPLGDIMGAEESISTADLESLSHHVGGSVYYQTVRNTAIGFAINARPDPGAPLSPADGYCHFMMQLDRANATADQRVRIYKNGVLVANSDFTISGTAVNSALFNWTIGGHHAGTAGETVASLTGAHVGDVWFDDTITGISVADFYNAGVAGDVGNTGDGPTGSAPLLYFSAKAAGGTGSSNGERFAVNRGTGGTFTLTGTLGNV